MARPSPSIFFRQSLKSDAFYSDELINIYLLRPIAAVIVWFLYPTSVTPNQVTVAAILLGLAAAITYTVNTPVAIAMAGLLVMAKDIMDDADGQLARAKQLYSRRGRFLDSIGDFAVDVAIFSAITSAVYQEHPGYLTIVLGILSLAGITLRVSYHVYYQVSYLHRQDLYKLNRIVEEINEEDRKGDPVALNLQKLFVLIYSWQDKLMQRIDNYCIGQNKGDDFFSRWYSDRTGLRLSGLLGFGTELSLLSACSLFNELYLYLILNVCLMNGILLFSVVYRKFFLASSSRS